MKYTKEFMRDVVRGALGVEWLHQTKVYHDLYTPADWGEQVDDEKDRDQTEQLAIIRWWARQVWLALRGSSPTPATLKINYLFPQGEHKAEVFIR